MNSQFLENKYFFMQKALGQAQKAFEKNEVPVGAIVVGPDGNIVSRAYNLVNKYKCQTQHAEMRAIKKACKVLGDWRLDGHWLYVTLEPCSMCIGLIKLCRISGLVYGADSPLFGYHLDKDNYLRVYKDNIEKGKEAVSVGGRRIEVVKGICAVESVKMLKQFFEKKRKKGEANE